MQRAAVRERQPRLESATPRLVRIVHARCLFHAAQSLCTHYVSTIPTGNSLPGPGLCGFSAKHYSAPSPVQVLVLLFAARAYAVKK